MNTIHPEAGKLTLFPYIVKTDLAGPDSERHRILAEIGRLLVPERRSNPDSRFFLSAPPSVSPSQIAHTLKGTTARRVFQSFPEVKKQLWGGARHGLVRTM